MRIRLISLIPATVPLAFLAALLATGQKNDQAEVQLKAAMHKELVDGDMQAAIQQYRQIIRNFASNRPVVARALVHLGQCHEKVGDAQARKAYERVVREFADQAEETRVARTRLAALIKHDSALSVRQVWKGPKADWTGQVSPDGRFLSFTDWQTGDLAIHDLVTGQDRRLTDKSRPTDSAGYAYALCSAPSPDSRQIAYAWYSPDGSGDLRIIGLDGSAPRVLRLGNENGEIQRLSWSPDGKYVLAELAKEDGARAMTLVVLADGSTKRLPTGMDRSPRGHAEFSPDGRYIAWTVKDGISLFHLETEKEYPLVADLGQHAVLGWTPEGSRLLFSSNRSGSTDMWLIAVTNGQASGEAQLVKKAYSGGAMGVTQAGTFYFGVRTPAREVYLAEVGPAATKLAAAPQPASRRLFGVSGSPDWSPDGKFLAYLRNPTQNNSFPSSIVIRSTSSGEERDLHLAGMPSTGFGLRCTPDGNAVVVSALQPGKGWALVRVDVQTGQPTPLMSKSLGPFARFDLSPDGKKLFYVNAPDAPNALRTQLLARDLQSGQETEIFSRPGLADFSVSPDGRRVVIGVQEDESTVLHLIPAAGGESRELISNRPKGIVYRVLAWTPDGRYVIFATTRKGERPTQNVQVWRVAAEGGEPERLDLAVDAPYYVRLHPDGRRIAIGTWKITTEIWAMENFLPPPETKKTEMTIRRVWEGNLLGAPTRDGRYLTFQDASENLAVCDLATGQKRLLTNKDPQSLEFAMLSVPSPDGKEVAYCWYNKDDGYDLRIVGLDGSRARVVHKDAGHYVEPTDWSPDGRRILAIFSPKGKPTQMALVSAADGSVRELKTFEGKSPKRARFSPDGRFIAYDLPHQAGSNVHDVYLLAAEGGSEVPLIQHPADDLVLDWTPDGKKLLFASDRSGTTGVWSIPILKGKPVGTATLLKADIGRGIRPMGFGPHGSFYYGIKTQMSDVHVAEVDLATGKIVVAPILATQRAAGFNSKPEWSDDGHQLLFLSTKEPGAWGAKSICIRSTETGQIRELTSKLNQVAWVRWSPDGRYLIGLTRIGNEFPLCRINVQTGEFDRLDLQRVIGLPPAWSRDSRAIYYHRWNSDKTTDIVHRDLATGREEVLHTLATPSIFYAGAVLSPDGKNLAFAVGELGASGPRVLKIMPATGGEARELVHEDQPLMRPPVIWTPDGRDLLFARRSTGGGKTELWLVSVQDGALRKLDLAAEGMRELSIHPDGRHIAYTAGHDISEVWVIENFLAGRK